MVVVLTAENQPLGLGRVVLDAAWERVMQRIRDRGEDPEDMLRRANENLKRWRAQRGSL